MAKHQSSQAGDYYQQLYDNKMDNLEEMDEYSENYNLPTLNQAEIISTDPHKHGKQNCNQKSSNHKKKISSEPDGLFTLMVTLATWIKQERECRVAIGLGKRVKMDRNNGFRRRGVGTEGIMA